jgi:HSP20 family protein
MTLIRWNPARAVRTWYPVNDFTSELLNMQKEIDRMFDRFQGGTTEGDAQSTFLPAVDIVERENDFLVKVELPGVHKEDVKITVQDDLLTIRGEKKSEEEKKGENYHRVERSYGNFQRSFTLPSSIKNEKIEASFINGVLHVTLPKLEEAKPKEIEVKVK